MAEMKCDVCDEEFDTENQLMQHKAQMHAGQTGMGEETGQGEMVDAREGMMPQPEGQMARENDDDLEEPDFPRAANE
jgi:hypothetical protein